MDPITKLITLLEATPKGVIPTLEESLQASIKNPDTFNKGLLLAEQIAQVLQEAEQVGRLPSSTPEEFLAAVCVLLGGAVFATVELEEEKKIE